MIFSAIVPGAGLPFGSPGPIPLVVLCPGVRRDRFPRAEDAVVMLIPERKGFSPFESVSNISSPFINKLPDMDSCG